MVKWKGKMSGFIFHYDTCIVRMHVKIKFYKIIKSNH